LAQPRYTITERDRIAAERYLSHKLQRGDWLTDDVSREIAAKTAYREAAGDAGALNAWCEEWLSRAQWMQLKHAIRAARRRNADRTRDPPKHVALQLLAQILVMMLLNVSCSALLSRGCSQQCLRISCLANSSIARLMISSMPHSLSASSNQSSACLNSFRSYFLSK
jgi:hypothetical protein